MHHFSVKKFLPDLCISNANSLSTLELLPVVNSGISFKYLGSYFNFEIDNEKDTVHLKSPLLDMMNLID